MNKEEALAYFGTTAQLGYAFTPPVTSSGVNYWGDTIPPLRQMQLEVMTQGALKADPGIFPDYIIKRETVAGIVRFERIPK